MHLNVLLPYLALSSLLQKRRPTKTLQNKYQRVVDASGEIAFFLARFNAVKFKYADLSVDNT